MATLDPPDTDTSASLYESETNQRIILSSLHIEPSQERSESQGKKKPTPKEYNTDLEKGKIRLYIPMGYPPFSSFYVTKIENTV
jgi:hypothetical protein